MYDKKKIKRVFTKKKKEFSENRYQITWFYPDVKLQIIRRLINPITVTYNHVTSKIRLIITYLVTPILREKFLFLPKFLR